MKDKHHMEEKMDKKLETKRDVLDLGTAKNVTKPTKEDIERITAEVISQIKTV